MSDLLTEERIEELEVPSELPVLPLKETVVFPQSMTPLAIGQERSIKLVEDAVDGNRLLAPHPLRELAQLLARQLREETDAEELVLANRAHRPTFGL